MGILPQKYDRYIRFFKFILKYRNDDLLSGDTETAEWQHSPEELVEDLKEMGPTYVKLGQLLSTRSDMLPQPFLSALATLQDDVESIPYQEVESIFREETGVRISKAFESFDQVPLASASIGQVHTAILHSGRKVAVKIQRPGTEEHFKEDLDTLLTLSEKAESFSEESRKFSLHETIEELRYILLQELDYEKEAENLGLLKKNMSHFKYLHVPEVITDYTSKRVLTMEYIDGDKVTKLSPFQLNNLPTEEMADDFVKGYLQQIIVDGFAHADPHPGNIHVMKTGKLALMDLGMVARFDDTMRQSILKLMIGLGENDAEEVTQVLLEISQYDPERINIQKYKKNILRKMQENQNKKAQDLQNGKTIIDINKISAQLGIKLPVELVSLAKILLNMDQIIAILAPDYNLQKTVRDYVKQLMKEHMWGELKTGDLLRNMLESKELLEKLPYRLNKISDDLAHHRFKIKMDVFDQNKFLLAVQKVANRITAGVIIAALIIGAALIMRIPSGWSIAGYPGFPVLLFIIAALIGFYLVYQILFRDENDKNDKINY